MEIWKLVLDAGADRQIRRQLLVSLILAFGHAVLYAAVPVLTVWALHVALLPESQHGTALWIGLAALFVTFLRFPVLSVQLAKSYAGAFQLGARLRERLLSHMRGLPLGVVRAQTSGRLVGIFNDDVKSIEAFIGGGAAIVIGTLFAPLLLLVFVFFLDPTSGLIIAGGFLLGFPILSLFAGSLKRGMVRRKNIIDTLSNRIGEHFSGMAVLRSFNAVGLADRDFKADMDSLSGLYRRSTLTMTPFSVFGLFVMEAALALCAFAGASAVNEGELPAEVLVFVLFAGLSLYNPILLLLGGTAQYRVARIATDNIRRFLALPPMISGDVAAPRAAGRGISFDAVSFRYDGKTDKALDSVSFVAEPGQLTAIVGPSGAGKSTVFNLIARFWDPQTGCIRIDGHDISRMPPERLSDLVAVVTQETVLINDTLKRNLDLGLPGIDGDRLNEAVDQARCAGFVDRLPGGLEARAGQDGVRLSGGEKQRLTIARALLKNAPIILLDEATASVDASNARLIQEAVGQLTRDRTVVVIAHRLSSIIDADKIIVMDKGHIVAEGRHEQLLAACPLYENLWRDHRATQRWTIAG